MKKLKTTNRVKRVWKRLDDGRYINVLTGWMIEESCEGGYNVYTDLGGLFDHDDSLRKVKKLYTRA